jgi:hypothetical protein
LGYWATIGRRGEERREDMMRVLRIREVRLIRKGEREVEENVREGECGRIGR